MAKKETLRRKRPPAAPAPAALRSVPARTLIAEELDNSTFPSLQLMHPLESIFKEALDQVRKGKGDARHGRGLDFMKQTWLETANTHGVGFLTGQAEKKLREAIDLEYANRRTERLGAIVYIAMAVLKDEIDSGFRRKS